MVRSASQDSSGSQAAWIPGAGAALSKLFRAKYKAIMKRLGLLDQIDPAVWQAGWNVDCQAVGDAERRCVIWHLMCFA